MGDYRARFAELNTQLDSHRQQITIVLAGGIGSRIADVGGVRKSALDDLTDTIRSTSQDPIGRTMSSKCQDALAKVVVPLAACCNLLTKDDAAVLEDWLEGASTVDSKFFKSLDAMGLGDLRDQMLEIQKGLQQMIGVLTQKWATMSEENQRLEALEQAASSQMTTIVQTAMAAGTDTLNKVGYFSKQILEPFMKIPDLVNEAVVAMAMEAGVPESVARLIPKISLAGKDTFQGAKELGIPAKDVAKALEFLSRDPGMAASETMQRVVGTQFEALVAIIVAYYKTVVPMLLGDYRAQVSNFQSALPNQGSVLVSLSQTRTDVDTFLKNAGLEKLQTLYEKATRAMEDWENGQPTPGLKADAAEFRAAAKSMFDDRFQTTTHAFEEFVRANKGRFVGSIERDTENALLWTDIWVDRTRGIANLGMDARLKEWRENTLTISAGFDTASQQVRQQLIGLPMGVADQIVARFDEAYAKMKDLLRTAVDPTISAFDSVLPTVTPDQITRDMDRSRLRDRLYAG